MRSGMNLKLPGSFTLDPMSLKAGFQLDTMAPFYLISGSPNSVKMKPPIF